MTNEEREHLHKIINERADAYINQDPDETPDPPRRYFAYRLTDGKIHVRRFTTQSAVDEAEGSTFVDEVLDPYEARDRAHAEAIALEYLARHLLG